VTFRDLSDAECRYYAASGEGLDKAGGYGIQHLGAALVEWVEGEYSNVVGFPLSVVIRLLRQAGVPVWGEVQSAAGVGRA
jgi:septum formation protein